MLNPELKQHIHESLLVPSKPSSYLLTTPYHLFRLSFSSTELIDVLVRQAHFLWFHTPLGSLQGSTGAPSHLPPPCPPSAAHDFLPSYGDGGGGAGKGHSPVGLALSRWVGCRCWMPAGSWLGMWMVAAWDAGV